MTAQSPDDDTARQQLREELDRPEVLQRLLDDAARAIEADRGSGDEGSVTGRDWAIAIAFAVILPAIIFFLSVSSQTYVTQ